MGLFCCPDKDSVFLHEIGYPKFMHGVTNKTKTIFMMLKKLHVIVCLIASTVLLAQEKERTGTVVDGQGIPVPGANVLIKGTNRGTQTDFDGNFQLLASEGETLIFSYIGMKSVEKVIGAETTLHISLEENTENLDEVVVIGYGTQSKRKVTGSVSSVEVEQMESQPNTNVAQAMRGRVAGVQFNDNGRPGQSGNLLIRGQSSLTASNDPLIILDGAFFYGELSDINPADVASMEVLKDASATAIYGARAANGVILITSKGGTSEKPLIRFNTYAGFSEYANTVPLYDAEGYLKRRRDYNIQNAGAGETPILDVENILDSRTELLQYQNGETVDPWKYVKQGAVQSSYNLSVSGRTEKTNYFISGGYVDEKGLIYGDKASRLSLRMNMENKITPWLTVGVNSMYSQRNLSGVNADIEGVYWLSPYARVRDENGEILPYPTNDQLLLNPLFNATQRKNEEIYNNLMASAFLKIDFPFLEGLSYRFNYNPNIQWGHNYTFIPIYRQHGINNLGAANKTNENRFNWQMEHIVKFEKRIKDHNFDLTLLYGANSLYKETTTAEGRNFFTDVNGWDNLEIADVQRNYSSGEDRTGVSAMARLNYQLKDRYLFTFTMRRDGSSVFGANNKYGNFPSAALGWIVTEEPFMDASREKINLLKLRLSYGKIGNQAVSPYSSLDKSMFDQYVFGDGSDTYTGSFPVSDNMPNPNLKWETSVSFNAAIDFGLFNNRIDGTLEYYNTKTTDLLTGRSIPTANGFSNVLTNIGEINNRGVEITLNTVNINKNDFRWTSSAVFSSNKNEIVHLYGSDADGDGREDDDLNNRWFIGQPRGVNFDYAFDGIYQEGDELPDGYRPGWVRVKDINGDGQITPEDRTVLSQRQPKYRIGFGNDFRYKGVSLSFFLNAAAGWKAPLPLLDPSPYSGTNYAGRSVNMIDAGYWTPENRSATRPSLNWTNPLGMSFYQSRDFLRLQDITIAYNFTDDLVKKLGLNALKVYVSGRNIYTWTDWMGPDPESGYSTIRDLYPSARTIVGGLDISF